MSTSSKINIKPSGDNKIVINGKEFFGFGITNVFTGDFPDVERFDADGNLDPKGTFTKNKNGILIKITADLFTDVKEVYNLNTQRHHNWVLIDLETGRGGGWYPGSRQQVYTLTDNVYLKQAASDDSNIALHLVASHSILEVVDILRDENNITWYKVIYDNIYNGFVKTADVSEIEYSN